MSVELLGKHYSPFVLSRRWMSASLQKVLNCCAAAKRREVPIASLIARTQKTERQVLAPRRINDPLLVYL